MKYKMTPLDIKAAGADAGLNEGEFVGYASVFGNVDSYGDVVVKGAFDRTLKGYGEKGAGIPAYWSHRMDDPDMNIGKTVEAFEDDHGLRVRVQLDLDSPKGKQVHKLIKEGRVGMMSFAYEVKDGLFREATDDLPAHYELRDLELYEVSVVPIGANTATELIDVKSILPDVPAKAFEEILERLGRIEAALSAATPSSDEEPTDAKAEELETANAEELTEAKTRTDARVAALAFLKSLEGETDVSA